MKGTLYKPITNFGLLFGLIPRLFKQKPYVKIYIDGQCSGNF